MQVYGAGGRELETLKLNPDVTEAVRFTVFVAARFTQSDNTEAFLSGTPPGVWAACVGLVMLIANSDAKKQLDIPRLCTKC